MASKPSREGKTVAQVQNCAKHADKPVNLACLTCKVLACETCRSQHSGHDIKPCERDGKLVQAICRAQTQEFYDILSILENHKDAKEEHGKALQYAKTVVNDNIQRIITKAREIQMRVDSQLDKAYDIVVTEESRVCDDIKKVDERIGKLTGVRNIKDTDILIPEAVKSSMVLEEFVKVKVSDKVENINIPEVVDILPGIDKLDGVLNEMDRAFEVHIDEGTDPFDYGSAGTLEPIDIPDKKGNLYRICGSGPDDTHDVSIHGLGCKDIHQYNMKSGTFSRKDYDCEIYMCAKVSKETYVACETSANMYILDNNGIQYSENMRNYCNRGVYYHSQNRVVALHCDGDTPCDVTLNRINITTGKFVVEHKIKVSLKDIPYFMCAKQDNNVISLLSKTNLYIVNMVTGEVKTHDISSYLAPACSIYVDNNDNTLMGDTKGRIHRFDRNMEHSIVAEVNGEVVLGLTIRNATLIATVDGKLWKQK